MRKASRLPGLASQIWLSHTCRRKAVTFCTSVISVTPCSAVLDGTLKKCASQGRLKRPRFTVGAYSVREAS